MFSVSNMCRIFLVHTGGLFGAHAKVDCQACESTCPSFVALYDGLAQPSFVLNAVPIIYHNMVTVSQCDHQHNPHAHD